jgi:hypothetical protein
MTRSRRRLTAAIASLALAGAASLALVGPVAAAPAWTPAHDISAADAAAAGQPGAALFGPRLGERRTATVAVSVWESGGVVEASERTAALGAWAPAKDISLAGASGLASARNMAVWKRDVGDDTVIESAIRLDGKWQPAGTVSAPGEDAAEPAVAPLTGAEVNVAGWLSAEGGNAVVRANVGWWYGGQGAWLGPVTLSVDGADASELQFAGRGPGVVAVWRSLEGGESRIRAALYSVAAKAWTTSVAVSPLGQVASEPRVATTADGLGVLVWVAGSGPAATIQAATLPADSDAWSEPVEISEPGASAPALAVAQGAKEPASQGAIAAWERADGPNQLVEAAHLPRDTGAWSTPERLSPEGEAAEAPFHQVDAVRSRHLQVGEQQVEAALAHGRQGLRGRGESISLVALVFERVAQGTHRRRLVVDDQEGLLMFSVRLRVCVHVRSPKFESRQPGHC